MSAEPITTDDPVAAAPARPRLGVVPQSVGATVSTVGFVSILLGLIAVGLAGVTIVTTNVGAQSRELSSLRRDATELSYTAAALESHIQRMSSANALALRASELGMVPNPYPAFINLADGTVTGVPTPATEDEMPFLRGIATKPVPAPALPTPTPSAQPADPGADSELVAVGATGAQQ